MKIDKLCERGGRKFNQDYADYAVAGEHICVAVADGLGAYASSEVASEEAVRAAIKWFRRAIRRNDEIFSGLAMLKLFKYAHAAILRAKSEAPELGGCCTTLSVVISDGKRLIAAHVGDSRIYYFKSNTLEFFSKDHSLARLAADKGEIAYKDIRAHRDQNKLTRVLGSDYFTQPDFKIYGNVSPTDSVLVCTDGFWEYVYENEMESTLASLDGAHDVLSRLEELLFSRAPEENDNYSAVLLRFDEYTADSAELDAAYDVLTDESTADDECSAPSGDSVTDDDSADNSAESNDPDDKED